MTVQSTYSSSRALCFVLAAVLAGASAGEALAGPGEVRWHQKISDTEGGFTGELDNLDRFGCSVAFLGDLDGDGVGDLAVGAHDDDDGGTSPYPNRGAVWVLFLNANGTVKSHQKISATEGGFTGWLNDWDYFGYSVAALGDLDGDGVGDLAVGAVMDDDGGHNHGAVWVLFLNVDGTVKLHQKVSDTEGGFTGILDMSDYFGASVASLGDLDGDGVGDLAVGADGDSDGGPGRGAVWVLFLNANGTVKWHQKISDTEGGFSGILDDMDYFGSSATSLGDLDGDGVGDLGVGAINDDDGGTAPDANRGAVWVLFLNADGTVKSHQKISDAEGGFTGTLDDEDRFGGSVTPLGDLDGDGVGELAVGAHAGDDGGQNRGALWMLFLNANGTVEWHQKISDTEGGFAGILDDGDSFGGSLASLGDLDGDCVDDLAVGARDDDDGGPGRGAVWVLFLDGVPEEYEARLDVKPGSCPNSFNRGSHGVLPVALVGREDFDVTTVDLSSILLSRADGVGGAIAPHEGPPGPHSVYEDVATPFEGELCDCHEYEGDGFVDLSMKFRVDEVVAALELDGLSPGALVELVVSGALVDGCAFTAADCVRLVPPGSSPGVLSVASNAAGAWIDVDPLDETLDGGGFADFERTYPSGSVVALTASETHEGLAFYGWELNGQLQRPRSATIEVVVAAEIMWLEAVYGEHAGVVVPKRMEIQRRQ